MCNMEKFDELDVIRLNPCNKKKEVITHSPYIVNMRIINAILIAHMPNILAMQNQINGLDLSLMDCCNGGIATNPRAKNRTAHTINPTISITPLSATKFYQPNHSDTMRHQSQAALS